jgi:hypothetical protein
MCFAAHTAATSMEQTAVTFTFAGAHLVRAATQVSYTDSEAHMALVSKLKGSRRIVSLSMARLNVRIASSLLRMAGSMCSLRLSDRRSGRFLARPVKRSNSTKPAQATLSGSLRRHFRVYAESQLTSRSQWPAASAGPILYSRSARAGES